MSIRRSSSGASKLHGGQRFTPFGRSTQRRILGQASRLVERTPQVPRENEEELASNLKGLTFKNWTVFRVSPLRKFYINPRSLKRYESSLSVNVEAVQHKGTFVENKSTGKAAISLYHGLKQTPADPDAIQILLRGKTRTGKHDVVQLTAILCGVGMEENPLPQGMREEFSYYPLLLVKGTVALTDTLICWLQNRFDCKVTAMTVPPYKLSWMVAMWSGRTTDPVHRSKPVQLAYSVPKECEGISRITHTVNPDECLTLWQSIHDSESDEFTAEEVTMFIKELEGQFYERFSINLQAMCLSYVGTSISCVRKDGRLKIYSTNHTHEILRHFTELSVEHFTEGH